MAEVGLKAEVRAERGKGPARRLRAIGKVPGIMYGRDTAPVSLTVDSRALLATLSTDARANVLIDLEVDGQTHLTLARAVERHPVRGTITHVDFLRIARDQKITVEVPIHFEGTAKGVKDGGGLLENHIWQLEVHCLPGNMPDRLTLDVSDIDVGDSISVRDVPVPEGVEILNDPDEVIASCLVPTLKVEAELDEVEDGVEGVEGVAEGEEAAEAEGAEGDAAEAPTEGSSGDES